MFLDNITKTGSTTIPSYYDQLFQKKLNDAKAVFDANLENEVRKQLKYHNIIIPDAGTPEWAQWVSDNLTQYSVSGTNTNVIAFGATDDGAGNITDIGTKLVEWEGAGYSLIIDNPETHITSFE